MNKCITLINVLLLCVAFAGLSHANSAFTTLPSGLEYKDLAFGSGAQAKKGDVAVIHFIGWLNDKGRRGKEIYNTRKHDRQVSFLIGTDRVMQGWNEGVIGMKVGGKRLLKIPPELGYGEKAVENIVPPRAHLIFVIELLEIK